MAFSHNTPKMGGATGRLPKLPEPQFIIVEKIKNTVWDNK